MSDRLKTVGSLLFRAAAAAEHGHGVLRSMNYHDDDDTIRYVELCIKESALFAAKAAWELAKARIARGWS